MSPFIILFPILALNALIGSTSSSFFVAAGLGCQLLLAWLLLKQAPHLARCLLVGCVILSIAAWQKYNFHQRQKELPTQKVLMRGQITDLQIRFDGAQKGFFSLDGIYGENGFAPASGQLAIVLHKSAAHNAPEGNPTLLLHGTITPFQPSPLPWGFNEQEFGLARQLLGRIHVHHFKSMMVVAQSPPSFSTSHWRASLRQKMAQLVTPREMSLLLALMIGDTGLFEPSQRELYQNVGAGHLLAVSGLQVTLFAILLYFILLRLPLLWRDDFSGKLVFFTGIGLILLFIWSYVALCAWPASAIRAAMMTTHFLVGNCLGRPQKLSHILCTSGSLSLLWHPAQILDPSFLLSYAALFGLLLFSDFGTSAHPIGRLLKTWVWGSLGSTLATLPFVAHFFGVFIPAGFVVNIFLIPVASFIQVPALALAGAGLLFTSSTACHWGAQIAGFLEAICERFCIWLPGPVPFPIFYWWHIVLCALVLITLTKSTWRYKIIAASLCTCLVVIAIQHLWAVKSLRVDVVPVGHGDASFLHFTNGQIMLIDGGGRPLRPDNPAPRALTNYINRYHISHIDVVVVSHPDPDHLLGLLEIMQNISVGELWHSGFTLDHPLMRRLYHLAHKKNILVRTGAQLDALHHIGTTQIEILHPFAHPGEVSIYPEFGVNDNSLVLKITHNRQTMLWTGDVEFFGEHALLKNPNALKAHVVKVPHHGSNTSSSPDFVQATRAQHAIFTVPTKSRFGFPKPNIQQRWEKAGVQTWSTGHHGLIRVWVHENEIELETARGSTD
ncbi:MAG: hypothetical protein CMH56_04810 [Myxococcales bacterium]|nr:hypothetical protein [Myxococcales bacterium]|tara:strand:- start:2916 stop:5261 length:2346 start_codon:yes stop_codon:yes gene_type:complete